MKNFVNEEITESLFTFINTFVNCYCINKCKNKSCPSSCQIVQFSNWLDSVKEGDFEQGKETSQNVSKTN